jgi:hypothetical protein
MLNGYRAEIWAQWDKQEAERKQRIIDQAFINMNNLYLSCESGKTRMSITVQNELYQLVGIVYPFRSEQIMNEYWQSEFEKLPNWFEF